MSRFGNVIISSNGITKVSPYISYYGIEQPSFIVDVHVDIDTYQPITHSEAEVVLKNTFASLYWPRETIISFEVVGDHVEIDVDLPEIEDTPLSYDGKNSLKTVGEYYYDYARHVHSVILRVIGIVFQVCSNVDVVQCSGYSQIFNHDTGLDDDLYLISILARRDRFEKLDIKTISKADPILFLSGMGVAVNMDRSYKMSNIK